MITELLVFGSKNFNNSIEEIKDNLRDIKAEKEDKKNDL